MQSNTTRAVPAHSKLSTCANRQFPTFLIAAIAFVAFVDAPKARAEEVIDLVMPFVQAGAYDPAMNTPPVVSLDDFSDDLKALVNAVATHGGAQGVGRVGIVDFAKADASGESGAGVEMLIAFTVEDPQNRPQVKSILNFKGVASSPPDPVGSRLGGASWGVRLGESDGGPLQLLVRDDLSSHVIAAPQIVGTPVFQLDMSVQSGGGGSCSSNIDMHGQRLSTRIIPDCGSITESGSLELTHAPGTYLMKVYVQAGNNGVVVGDPVWQPHPDNPDVVIRRHAPTGSPGTPLAGTTPADLEARGIDPTPFIEAGFFDAPPPPPPGDGDDGDSTPPADKDWCGPGFWFNNALKFSSSAWPAPTYFDYNSTAGQRAGCPVATGNPTLLQALQNPSLYFSTQVKGAGFNCVADYLSGKVGLAGTAAENNGVCSIDQFGQQMP